MTTATRRRTPPAAGATPGGATGDAVGAQGGARTVQSLERAFAILEAIAAADEPPTLAELSRVTGLHTSTAFHLIKTLMVLGYVRQDDTKRYRVGARLFMQAAGAFTENELVRFATPWLRRLADETGETAHLGVRADHGIAVIAKVEARSTIRTSERLGIIRPAHCTAIGKVLLAALPEDELEGYLRRGPFEAFSPRTMTDPARLREECRAVGERGLAVDDAEFNAELRCLAAPVSNFTQQTIGALGISGPIWRMTPDVMLRLGRQVTETAAALSRDLGGRGR